MLWDLTGKKPAKSGKGAFLTENRFSRNEMWCAVVNHNYMYRICTKEVLDLISI